MTRCAATLLGLLLLVAPGPAGAHGDEEHGEAPIREVEVVLKDFSIGLPDTLPAGPTRFLFRNEGQAEHNVEFQGQGLDRALPENIPPGGTARLELDLAPGGYSVWCPVGRHESLGMHTELVVVSAGGAAPAAASLPEHGAGLPPLLRWLGRFHPPSVNFPIALLVAAAVAELLLLRTGRPAFDAAARYCLWCGALGAAVAGLLGWLFGGLALGEDSDLLQLHRWIGTGTVLAALLVLWLGERSRGAGAARTPYRIALFCVAALVLVTGFLGGAMIYGLGHYAWGG